MITESLVKEVFDQLLTAIAAEADAAILSVRLPTFAWSHFTFFLRSEPFKC